MHEKWFAACDLNDHNCGPCKTTDQWVNEEQNHKNPVLCISGGVNRVISILLPSLLPQGDEEQTHEYFS